MSQYLIAHIGHTTRYCEHIIWWRPESKGYTVCTDKAGTYTEQEALSICSPLRGLCIAVSKESAAKLARTTPYYRRPDGSLAKMYDGDVLAPVPNGRAVWRALGDARLNSWQMDKPTPIPPSKSRAIYLPPNLSQKGGE
ncbi:hypothetical protein CEK28_08605 [Xenophilus sp. AP218F]|nr:hypothetical protein CEK28_08605 [Xenophilus sp. AP218F]